jgi:hypothetical protein
MLLGMFGGIVADMPAVREFDLVTYRTLPAPSFSQLCCHITLLSLSPNLATVGFLSPERERSYRRARSATYARFLWR